MSSRCSTTGRRGDGRDTDHLRHRQCPRQADPHRLPRLRRAAHGGPREPLPDPPARPEDCARARTDRRQRRWRDDHGAARAHPRQRQGGGQRAARGGRPDRNRSLRHRGGAALRCRARARGNPGRLEFAYRGSPGPHHPAQAALPAAPSVLPVVLRGTARRPRCPGCPGPARCPQRIASRTGIARHVRSGRAGTGGAQLPQGMEPGVADAIAPGVRRQLPRLP